MVSSLILKEATVATFGAGGNSESDSSSDASETTSILSFPLSIHVPVSESKSYKLKSLDLVQLSISTFILFSLLTNTCVLLVEALISTIPPDSNALSIPFSV